MSGGFVPFSGYSEPHEEQDEEEDVTRHPLPTLCPTLCPTLWHPLAVYSRIAAPRCSELFPTHCTAAPRPHCLQVPFALCSADDFSSERNSMERSLRAATEPPHSAQPVHRRCSSRVLSSWGGGSAAARGGLEAWIKMRQHDEDDEERAFRKEHAEGMHQQQATIAAAM